MVALAERRTTLRTRIDWPISLYHADLGMFINGRSVDVSRGGAKIRLPVPVPVRPGQIVELNFPRTTTLAKMAGCYSRIKVAQVIRVEFDGRTPNDRPSRQLISVRFDRNALAAAAVRDEVLD